MKKLVLSAVFLFSVSCLWNTQGKASECPKERPFLIREWKNENCPQFKDIEQLFELKHLDFPRWIRISDYQYNPDKDNPDLLPELEKIKEKISDMKKAQEVISKTIREENLKIDEENQKVQEKNKFFKTKQKNIDKYHDKCRLGWNIFHLEGLDITAYPPTMIVDTSNLESYLESSEHAISYNTEETERTQRGNSYIRDTNIDTFFDNMKWEYKNNLTISEFEKFYTPEKEKQLLEEYEKAQNEFCVGCDYPDLNEYQCGKCPNREYVDGKCVFKKEEK